MNETELEDYNEYISKVFSLPSTNEDKLVLCGPRFCGMITGCYNPKYWPRLRGSSAQRRIKRRWLQRMWDVTKDSPYITEPPSLQLTTW